MWWIIHKISLRCGGPYIDSAESIKSKRDTINPQNYDNICFQYVVKVTFKHKIIEKHPEK